MIKYCFIYRDGNVEGGVRYSSTYTYFILSFERSSYFVIWNKNTRAPLYRRTLYPEVYSG